MNKPEDVFVYIVHNCGGRIYGVYSSYEKANIAKDRINLPWESLYISCKKVDA